MLTESDEQRLYPLAAALADWAFLTPEAAPYPSFS